MDPLRPPQHSSPLNKFSQIRPMAQILGPTGMKSQAPAIAPVAPGAAEKPGKPTATPVVGMHQEQQTTPKKRQKKQTQQQNQTQKEAPYFNTPFLFGSWGHHSTLGTAAKWFGAYKGMDWGLRGLGAAGGILTGSPQEEILPVRREMAAAGATGYQRSGLELEAMRTKAQFPYLDYKQTLQASATAGTYFPISEYGVQLPSEAAKYIAIRQQVGGIKDANLAADVLLAPISAKLGRMTETERQQKADTSKSPWVMQQLKRNFSIMGKADEIFPLRGQDMAEFQKHALGMAEERGIPLEEALNELGWARKLAQRSSSAGRGYRTIRQKLPHWLAKLMILGDDKLNWDKMKPVERNKLTSQLEDWIRGQEQQDPNIVNDFYARAFTQAKLKGYADPLAKIGTDQQWRSQMSTEGTPELRAQKARTLQQLRESADNPNPLAEYSQERMRDFTTPGKRVTDAASQFSLGLSNLATQDQTINLTADAISLALSKVGIGAQAQATASQVEREAKRQGWSEAEKENRLKDAGLERRPYKGFLDSLSNLTIPQMGEMVLSPQKLITKFLGDWISPPQDIIVPRDKSKDLAPQQPSENSPYQQIEKAKEQQTTAPAFELPAKWTEVPTSLDSAASKLSAAADKLGNIQLPQPSNRQTPVRGENGGGWIPR